MDVGGLRVASITDTIDGPASWTIERDVHMLILHDAGSYHCVVTNAGGTATSPAAVLTVVPSTNPGRLVNLAIRTNAGAGAQTLLVGAAIGGAGASGTQSLLLRAAGPALAAFGLPGTLADPALALISGGNTVANNDNWNGDAEVIATATRVGAFAFASTSSKDAALVRAGLAPGTYSMQVSSGGTAAAPRSRPRAAAAAGRRTARQGAGGAARGRG